MALIYETENFILEASENPEIDRLDGGHMKISPKIPIIDRSLLTPKQAIELMRFTIIAGKAMISWMKKRWVKIWRINYQDNGNWKPKLHIHLYGRAIDAKTQKYWDPITPWHKEGFKTLDEEDIAEIKNECDKLFNSEEFSDKNRWLS